MTDRQNKQDNESSEDVFVYDEAAFSDEDFEEEAATSAPRGRARSVNMDMRHRIEEKLEQRRLMKELNEYEFFDIDDENPLH